MEKRLSVPGKGVKLVEGGYMVHSVGHKAIEGTTMRRLPTYNKRGQISCDGGFQNLTIGKNT